MRAAQAGLLVAVFALGVTLPALVAPALADDPPPTTGPTTDVTPTTTATTSPNPDPAPQPAPAPKTSTATTKALTKPKPKASAPAPKPATTTSRTTIATPTPVAPASTPLTTENSFAPVKPLGITKKKSHVSRPKRKHVRTAPAKKAEEPAVKKRAPERTPIARINPPIASFSSSSNGAPGARLLLIVLLVLPALLLLATVVPIRALPPRLAGGWIEHRMDVGMLAGSLLLIDALLYALAG